MGRQNNEDQNKVQNIVDGHHNANNAPKGDYSIQLELQNQVTQFSMNLNTLASGNILYDEFELSQHSRLYAVFQALKEGNLYIVEDLVPEIEDPVSGSVE